jgi:glycosyltransferase involved in cell wall biosynthesis
MNQWSLVQNNNTLELTCLIPCLNEQETLASCIKDAQKSIASIGLTGEILVADNGSTDGSVEIAKSLDARVINVQQKGYGSALINGIRSAQGKFIIMGDADGTYEWDKLQQIYAKLDQGFDLVMGNRFSGQISNSAMPFLSRYIGNPILSFLGKLFFKIKINDFHCGLRGFSREKMLNLQLNSLGMEFASEIIIKSALTNLKITEVPTKLLPGPAGRKPHLRPFRDGWRHLRLMLAFAPTWSAIYPGILFLTLGLSLSSIIFFGEGNFFSLNLKEHSLIVAMGLIFLGFSSILLGVLGLFSLSNYPKYREKQVLKYLSKSQTLELLLIVGFTLIIAGLVSLIQSIQFWSTFNFSSLEPAGLIFQISPSVLLLLMGFQIIFVSFLFETIKNNLNKNF